MPQTSSGHFVEYGIEAAALGTFMVSASFFSVLLEHPASPVHQAIRMPAVRHVLGGIAMGLTSIALVYSKPGRRSGAHMNPALTLTFFRLGKVSLADALGYVAAQFVGATVVMAALVGLARPLLADPAINFVRTVPGPAGAPVAFAAEAAISFGLMLAVLVVSNSRFRAFTGVAAGVLVATYISVEAPLSGMSMNPARSAGPALVSAMTESLWIYCLAPLAGMLLAAELFVRWRGIAAVACAKLHHDATGRCIFHCTWTLDRNGSSVAGCSVPEREASADCQRLVRHPAAR